MNITREHFEGDWLGAMDEIAVLVLAVKTLRASGEAFEHTEDLGADRTYDTAKPVLEFLEGTAIDLLEAICKGKTKRSLLLAEIRTGGAVQLTELLPKVEALARQEIATFEGKDTGGASVGTNVRDLALQPMRTLLDAWSIDRP